MSICFSEHRLPKIFPQKPTHRHWQALSTLSELSPSDFLAKWLVSHEALAEICGCSVSTVHRWFGSSHSRPKVIHLQRLASVDFIWSSISSKSQ